MLTLSGLVEMSCDMAQVLLSYNKYTKCTIRLGSSRYCEIRALLPMYSLEFTNQTFCFVLVLVSVGDGKIEVKSYTQ